MINILTSSLPDEICGQKIDTDFRTWIKVSKLFEKLCTNDSDDDQFYNLRIINEVIKILNLEVSFLDRNAIDGILDFYLCGKKINTREKAASERLLDYEFDSRLIFAAFLQIYKIDLTKEKLHWWVFKALLDLSDDSVLLGKVIGWRATNLSKIKDKEQRAHYRKLKRAWALPDERSEAEKERDMISALESIF